MRHTTKKRFLLFRFAVLALLLCIAGTWYLINRFNAPPPVIDNPPTTEIVTTTEPTTLPQPTEPLNFERTDGEKVPPIRIEIPALKIDAPIESVGADNEGRMATSNKGENVAWYKHGPAPGFQGNSLLNGHNNWNKKAAVFAKLPSLSLDEIITIYYEDGSWGTFKVISNESYPLDDIPDTVMSFEGPTRTTIISCTGTYRTSLGTHDQRCIVLLQHLDYYEAVSPYE